MSTCLIGLGSNLGDRASLLEAAVQNIAAQGNISVLAKSRIFRSAPIGGPAGQSEFFNSAIKIETALAPLDLLDCLQNIELGLGRNRQQRWDARPIDLDLLLYDNLLQGDPLPGDQLIMQTATLVLPHPRMAFRRFVLAPLVEIAAEMVHPCTGWTIQRLWNHISTTESYVAIAGVPRSGKTQLARLVAEKTGVRLISAPAPALPQPRQPTSADSAGDSNDHSEQTFSDQIALMQRRAALLQSSARHKESISDFWFAQSMVCARLCLTDRFQQQFQQQYNEFARQVTPPKLLLFLDNRPCQTSEAPSPAEKPAPQKQPSRGGSNEGASESTENRLGRLLRDQALQSDQGPLLLLDASNPAWALTEACAAIEAMRCQVIAVH